METKPLAGTVALITDAGDDIGAATGRRLAAAGAAVALVAQRRDRLDRLVSEIAAEYGVAHPFPADITDTDQAGQAIVDTIDRFDRLDILINNAVVLVPGTALHTTVAEWDRMIALNVRALVHLTHAAVPYLIAAAATAPRHVADVVNLGSVACAEAGAFSSVYHLTQSGVAGFTEALRQELLDEHVRVSLVEPGVVSTELADHLDDAIRERWQRHAERVDPRHPRQVADTIAAIVTRD